MLEHGSAKIGAIIRTARLYHKITQGELARRMGITQGTLSRVEHGTRPLGLDLLEWLERIGVHVIFRTSKPQDPQKTP